MPRVLFTQAARADLAEAVDWYDAHAAHMVLRFRQALRVAVARIAANPKQFPVGPHQTRRALLQRFPYLLVFRESEDACYVVAALPHEPRSDRVVASNEMNVRLEPQD
jgi:plasmid stabilization system protein ParE